jgi:hypothetical protein
VTSAVRDHDHRAVDVVVDCPREVTLVGWSTLHRTASGLGFDHTCVCGRGYITLAFLFESHLWGNDCCGSETFTCRQFLYTSMMAKDWAFIVAIGILVILRIFWSLYQSYTRQQLRRELKRIRDEQ